MASKKQRTITIDNEFSGLLPKLTDVELGQLEANIIRDGCIAPLPLWHGILLDNHNCYAMYRKHGIEFSTIDIELASRNDAKIWIIKKHLGRRNLTPFQRAELVAKYLEPAYVIKGKERMSKGGSKKGLVNSPNLNTREDMAKLAGVSGQTYDRSKKIITSATEEDKEALRTGKATINEVFLDIRRAEKKEERIEALSEKAKQYKFATEKVQILEGDFYKVSEQIADDSVDDIVTDPPYLGKFLDCYEKLGQVAKRVLRPGGRLITYCGTYHINEIFTLLSKNLKFYWMLSLPHKGPYARVHNRNIEVRYKPILIFSKPVTGKKQLEKQAEYVSDMIDCGKREKDLHEWQQGEEEAIQIIERFTQPNDLVLDCFAGSGTTLAACLKSKRRCIGIEIESEYVRKIKMRLGISTADK